MKLNYKNIFFIGLIFFSISLFWQTYDVMISRTLIDKYGLNQFWSGIVMALDNVLAVIMLPLFGALSDKSNAKIGRRTPYVIVGTILAAFAFMALSYTDYKQTLLIQETNIVSDHYELAFAKDADNRDPSHWVIVIDRMAQERYDTYTSGAISYDKYTQFITNIKEPMEHRIAGIDQLNNRDLSIVKEYYYRYLSERAWETTASNNGNIIVFSMILFVALIAMSIYRSPAVALMPDVTIRPLRSKANAIISLMGAIGGVLGIYIIMIFGLNKNEYDYYTYVYITVGIIMLINLVIFLKHVNEPMFVKDRVKEEKRLGIFKEEVKSTSKKLLSELNFKRRISLYFLLAGIFTLFMGYNAVMSKIGDYLPKVLNINLFDIPLVLAQALVILSIYPIGILSLKIGRKKSVSLGIIILSIAFGTVFFLKENQLVLTALIIYLAGIGWTMISINIYVMVVDLSKGSDSGRYTGFYYSASMSAQIITPILSGYLMEKNEIGRLILFPYATFFILISIVFIAFVKLEDVKIKKNKNSLEVM